MLIILLALLVFLLIFVPSLWCRLTLSRHAKPREDIPGTGGELAKHLLNRLGLAEVKVEETQEGQDHYDPGSRTVRLSPSHYNGKSLTAITVAAHEVGHAIQHYQQYKWFGLRTQLAYFSYYAERIASYLLVGFPFITMLAKLPHLGLLMFACGIIIMLLPVIMHLITLPVEWDASFNRALPILEKGQYLPENTLPKARKILTAAALTYVAASLNSLLNFYRWFAIMRR